MAERICLFPGTFDPITLGHTDIINRALPLFDKIFVGIGINAIKMPMYSIQQRIDWMVEIYKDEPKVFCVSYGGLTVEFCKLIKAHFILRGIRYVSDFEYEKTIADAILDRIEHNANRIELSGESLRRKMAQKNKDNDNLMEEF